MASAPVVSPLYREHEGERGACPRVVRDQENVDAARELYGAANRLGGSRHLAAAKRDLLRSRLQFAYGQLAGK